jgi:hypothetical protein
MLTNIIGHYFGPSTRKLIMGALAACTYKIKSAKKPCHSTPFFKKAGAGLIKKQNLTKYGILLYLFIFIPKFK